MLIKDLLVALLGPATTFKPGPTEQTDCLAAEALQNARDLQHETRSYGRDQSNGYDGSTCTPENLLVRREWDAFSRGEKLAYIDAVKCLMSLPAQSSDFAPGARNRWDDWSAGNFLHWHRYFTFLFERALRNECGYTGLQPYLNWPRYAHDLHNAPVFDGSDTSLGNNGAYDPKHNGTNIPSNAFPYITLPAEGGGGCITSGPFANTTVRLGSVAPALSDVPANPLANGLGYNPRCIRRDISGTAAKQYLTDTSVYTLLTTSPNISSFQTTLQGDFPNGYLGIHTAGHCGVGGDPGGDLFASTGDPYFFLHHAAIDRAWWIWQNLEPNGTRYREIAGTLTTMNTPPSRNTSLEDWLDMGPLGDSIRIAEGVDTLKGPYCYVYE
ncbi:Di-copper centre-containing [Lecanosticta acicola]|uniref:Di-copper centre-containing n=1 Tax=Lecanosticta acicola TaxID=111012 RepID=A0AAI8VUY9_9PEZI|nr:Di-copper centre-containing [Lecanosticta acicola]